MIFSAGSTPARSQSPPRRLAAGLALLGGLLIVACGQPAAESTAASDAPGRAAELARELLIVDTHIDVPYRLENQEADLSQRTEDGDFDYPRAVEGGLNAAFLSIYVPASYQETGGAKEVADRLIDRVERFESEHPDKFAVARSTADVERQFAQGLLSLPMGMENGAPIEDDLENLRHFHRRGIRYITLTHSRDNLIADSSYDDRRTWGGLSPFGRQVVQEMNRLGVMIDVSHISDATFDQVMELTQAPVIASHSSCRAFTPGWERNMSDDQIRRLAANGGVIQINFGSAFLTATAQAQSDARWRAIDRYAEEHGLEAGSDELQQFSRSYREQNPITLADVTDVADHIDHVVELVGVDHVGLGSDFDGVGPTTPTGLEDVSRYPNLIRVLLERGYSEEEIAKICGGNLMRVWRRVEQLSESAAPAAASG